MTTKRTVYRCIFSNVRRLQKPATTSATTKEFSSLKDLKGKGSSFIGMAAATSDLCQLAVEINRSPQMVLVNSAHVLAATLAAVALVFYLRTPFIRRVFGVVGTNLKATMDSFAVIITRFRRFFGSESVITCWVSELP